MKNNFIGKRELSHLSVCMYTSWIGLNSFWAHFWIILLQLKSTETNSSDRELVRCKVDEEDFKFVLKTDIYECLLCLNRGVLVECTFLNTVLSFCPTLPLYAD